VRDATSDSFAFPGQWKSCLKQSKPSLLEATLIQRELEANRGKQHEVWAPAAGRGDSPLATGWKEILSRDGSQQKPTCISPTFKVSHLGFHYRERQTERECVCVCVYSFNEKQCWIVYRCFVEGVCFLWDTGWILTYKLRQLPSTSTRLDSYSLYSTEVREKLAKLPYTSACRTAVQMSVFATCHIDKSSFGFPSGFRRIVRWPSSSPALPT
jgi:hypothetical protein